MELPKTNYKKVPGSDLYLLSRSWSILQKGGVPMVLRCADCHQILSPTTKDDGMKYECSCGFSEVFPIVKGVIAKSSDFKFGVAVLVNCPFCGKKHYHSTQPLPSLRKSHCQSGIYYVYVWLPLLRSNPVCQSEYQTSHQSYSSPKSIPTPPLVSQKA